MFLSYMWIGIGIGLGWVGVGSLCGATIRASLCDAKNDIRDVCSIADFIDSHNPLMVSFSVALDN